MNSVDRPKSFFEYMTMDSQVPFVAKKAPFLATVALYGSVAVFAATLYFIYQYDKTQ